ncbi:UNVERIFIED_CONTAM: hypothetical protein HDU68_012582 [Siphonaria sp. JEL0065]|nr:hypothetical protein HDU68_012582 [Siphonaria sp. JEL0065]
MSFSVQSVGCYTGDVFNPIYDNQNVNKQNCASGCYGSGTKYIAIANDPHNILQNANMFSCYCLNSLSSLQKYYTSACDRKCLNGDACGQDNFLVLNLLPTDFRVSSIYQIIENAPIPVPVPPSPAPPIPAPTQAPPVPVVSVPAPNTFPVPVQPPVPPVPNVSQQPEVVTKQSNANDAKPPSQGSSTSDPVAHSPAPTGDSLLTPKLIPAQLPNPTTTLQNSPINIPLIITLAIIGLIVLIGTFLYAVKKRTSAKQNINVEENRKTLTRTGTVFKKPFNAGEFNIFYERSVPAGTVERNMSKSQDNDAYSILSSSSFKPLFPTRASRTGNVRVSDQLKRNDTSSTFGGVLRGFSGKMKRDTMATNSAVIVRVEGGEQEGVKRTDTVLTSSSSLFKFLK